MTRFAPRRVTAVFLMGMMSLLGFRPRSGDARNAARRSRWTDGRTTITRRISARARRRRRALRALRRGRRRSARRPARCAIYRRSCGAGWRALSEAGECSDALFGALRQMAQERLGVQIRSESCCNASAFSRRRIRKGADKRITDISRAKRVFAAERIFKADRKALWVGAKPHI